MKTSLHKLLKSELIWLFAIAAIVSLGIIFWSFEHGRLQYEMDYEDIITHIDGLKRSQDLSEGGVGQFLANYLKSPPHAPLHSMMAMSGFMLLGVRDWAPYAMNVLMLFAFLLLVRHETRVFGAWPSGLALLGALFVPVSFQSVHQFRPDFPCALATLWGMVLYPSWREEKFCKKAAISGALFGLALLSKPPFFPYTLAMGGLPWLLAVWGGIREKKSLGGMWGPILQSWPFFAATVLVSGPHYFVAWRRILEYINLNQFGADAHVWRMTGGLDFQLVYHVFGYSGQFMLGQDVWILLGLTGIGLVLAMLRRKADSENCRHFGRLAAFVLWAWIFIAWNPHENPFFGLAFQYGLVVTGMVAAAWMVQLTWDSGFPRRIMAIIPIALVAIVAWRDFPLPEYDQNSAASAIIRPNGVDIKEFTKKLPSEMYKRLCLWRRYSDSGYTLLSTYGIVSSHRLQWLAMKGREDFRFYGVPYWTLDKLIPLLDQETKINHRVDFVMVTEPGAEGVFEELPNSKTSGGLLEWMKRQDSYTCVETLLTPSNKKYCLFMAIPNFSIFNSTEGLGPRSEPLNIEGTPVVRPATADTVTLNYDSPAEGEATLELVLRGKPPLSQVEVAIQGKPVERFPLVPGYGFSEKIVHLKLGKGLNTIDIHLLDQNGHPLNNPSSQFRRIRITPPGDTNPVSDILRKAEKSEG